MAVLLRGEDKFADAFEGHEHRLDQRSLLFKTLLVELGMHQDDLAGAAAHQPRGELVKGQLVGAEFVGVVPDGSSLPLAVEHVRMRERLLQAFEPGIAARIQPDLILDRAVLQKECKCRGDDNRALGGFLPAAQVLG